MRFPALPKASLPRLRLLLSLIAGAGLLAPAAAVAASSFEIDCHGGSPEASADTSLEGLDLTVVDLATPDGAGLDDVPLVVDDEAGSAPILNLGPRVATLVRDIFGSSELDERFGSPAESQDLAMPPLAENGEDATSREPLTEADAQSDEGLPYSPLRVHREMYRTDI